MTPYHSNKKYIGIDPGKSGGIACIDEDYGQWLGITASHEIKMNVVIPNCWIKWVGCPKALAVKKRKHWLRDKAKELYPELKKVTLATADAILITHYAKEKFFNG